MEYQEVTDGQDEKLSKSHRAEFVSSLSFLIIDKYSMIKGVLFEHVDDILKDFRCQNKGGSRSSSIHRQPYFGGLAVVFTCDDLHILPVVRSQKYLEIPKGEVRVINVSLLDDIPWK